MLVAASQSSIRIHSSSLIKWEEIDNKNRSKRTQTKTQKMIFFTKKKKPLKKHPISK